MLTLSTVTLTHTSPYLLMPREWLDAAYHLRVVNGDRFGCIKKTLHFADPNREEFRMAMELKLFRIAGQSQRSRFVVDAFWSP